MIELFPKKNLYKANLHCHTVISDGKWTPEQVKEEYKKQGYSVVAYTDHELYVRHNDLTDDTFVALNAVEAGLDESDIRSKKNRVLHLNLIAMDPDNDNNPLWNRQKYYEPYFNHDCIPMNEIHDDTPDFWREYSADGINKMIKTAKENGFFVTYNHPEWSRETHNEYLAYEGMDAMEIMNYGSSLDGTDEFNGFVYYEMLRAGKRVFVNAGDDNHNERPVGHSHFDSFGAYTMISADKLDYRTITKALADGDAYASEGPIFTSITFDPETNKVHIEFEPCSCIALLSDSRRYRTKYACDGEGEMTYADFQLFPEDDVYFRIVLTDKNRHRAFSRAYFLDTFMK